MGMFSGHESLPRLNCLCDGEVLKVSEGSGEGGKGPVLYDVAVTMPTGSQVVLVNVPTASMFGGIGDYFQYRLRGSFDDDSNAPSDEQYFSDSARGATLGSRVLIAFVGGHLSRPLIVGFPPHPTTNWHYDKHAEKKPQGIFTYQGVTMSWDEKGQFEIIRRGAPEVKFVPPKEGLFGAIAGAAGALGGALSGGDDPTKPSEIPNLTPAEDIEVLRLAFREGGVFRLNDYNGQMIEMDATKERIYISNNDIKSIDGPDASGGPQIATNSTDAEYILWDRGKEMILINTRSLLELYSFDRRKDVTDGDYLAKCHGQVEWQIDGDLTESVGGAQETSIESDWNVDVGGDVAHSFSGNYSCNVSGDYDLSVQGAATHTVTGAFSVSSKGDVKLEGIGASLLLSNGKVALKGASGELVDLVGQLVDAILQMTVPTGVGPSGPPINTPIFTQIKTLLATLKA